MISVAEAQQKILEHVERRAPIEAPLTEAVGRILAAPVHAPFDLPSFDNSAMDGYAICAEDTKPATDDAPIWLKVAQTVTAGSNPQQGLKAGEAARIFTGAMLPPGANAVIRQEEVLKKLTEIAIKRVVSRGENIRHQGEESRAGQTLLQGGERLSPATIGMLAALGLKKVTVFSPPRVGIVATGSEIITDLAALKPGKVFDSNSFSLRAALQELGLSPSYLKTAPDQKDRLRIALQEGLAESDCLLATGGVSVGDYDFVRDIASHIGIRTIFWGVRQKPGKPIFFGKREDGKLLFGLPGNPASALVCYYEYVRPALLRGMGARSLFLPRLTARLAHSYQKGVGRVYFLRGILRNASEAASVTILEQQGSHIMTSFVAANCLVQLPEEWEHVEAGESVATDLLPHFFMSPPSS